MRAGANPEGEAAPKPIVLSPGAGLCPKLLALTPRARLHLKIISVNLEGGAAPKSLVLTPRAGLHRRKHLRIRNLHIYFTVIESSRVVVRALPRLVPLANGVVPKERFAKHQIGQWRRLR